MHTIVNIEEGASFKCTHCDDLIPLGIEIVVDNNFYCCRGCKTVHTILNNNGLGDFYKIRNEEGVKSDPVKTSHQDFNYLDDQKFQAEFTKSRNEEVSIKFYLEGIHCMACLWLIERTPHFITGLISARLNITDSTVVFIYQKSLKLSELTEQVHSLGYTPHPLKFEESSKSFQVKEERRELLRIGVAGAAMGNVMLYAISNYAGADGLFRVVFNWISFFAVIPVVFYSAIPLYKTSILAIKHRTVSIDTPLSIAIIAGFIFSSISLLRTGEHLYFDSVSTLVFLILLSRYFVKKATQSGLNTKGIQTFFTNTGVQRILENGEIESVHSKYIKEEDVVLIRAEEKIVFDVALLSNATVDNSVITGESKPQLLAQGDLAFAGSMNLGPQFSAKVIKTGSATRVGKIINEIDSSVQSKSQITLKADKISKYFVFAVLVLTTIAFFTTYFTSGFSEALARALSIIIISCPCALALATPLAFIRTMGQLKERGIYIKNENVIERLNEIKNIILDKTGTITEGKFKVLHFENLSELDDEEIHNLSLLLEAPSIHPIAISLKRHFNNIISLPGEVTNYRSITGFGVVGKIENTEYFIGKLKENQRTKTYEEATQIGLYKNHQLLAKYILGDQVIKGTHRAVKDLQENNREIFMASGDHENVVMTLSESLGIKATNTFSNQTPEDKALLISNLRDTLMIGDGANDALALKKADVGIAVGGSVDLTLRASDIFLSRPGLNSIRTLVLSAKETEKVIKRNFVFSLAYNFTGVSLALLGLVTPLWAAIFMPVSSLTVVISSFYGTRKLNLLMKEQLP